MNIRKQIETKIRIELAPIYLIVKDESFKHHHNSDVKKTILHFNIVVVSNLFNSQLLLSRHRLMFSILADELKSRIHAIAMHTYTVKEWEHLQDHVFSSPPCCRQLIKPFV